MAETQPLPSYRPGPVERFGRRYKMEYVGMASVFTVLGLLFFGRFDFWYQSLAATLAVYCLFLGIKKKTRDHLSASLLLFAASAAALPGLASHPDWIGSWFLFGLCVFILEGYLEKLQNHIFALPLVFAAWGALDLSWVAGLAFAALYLACPLAEKPGWRPRLAAVLALSTVCGTIATALRFAAVTAPWSARARPVAAGAETALWLGGAALVLTLIAVYWRHLLLPRRLNGVLFALLCPWDARLAALFAMVAAVVLSATVFRLSIDSDRLRPIFKHAEWHFFWYVLVLAVWAGFHA